MELKLHFYEEHLMHVNEVSSILADVSRPKLANANTKPRAARTSTCKPKMPERALPARLWP